jgi:hypothetical protein
MTDEERLAVRLLGEAWNAVLACVPDEQSRREACSAVHIVQNIVLAQATVRTEPGFLRQPAA